MLALALPLLLALPAAAAPVLDRDAACAWAALQVAVAVQRAHEQIHDAYAPALLPVEDLPMPAACAARVEVWVEEPGPTDDALSLCAWVPAGPGAGRSFCADAMAEVMELAERRTAPPVEDSDEVAPGLADAYAALPALIRDHLGPADRPLPVTQGEDGRVVGALDEGQVQQCLVATLRELQLGEFAVDAAFDSFSDDYGWIGFRLDQPLSCPAHLAARIAWATETSFRVEVLALEGDDAGRGRAFTHPGGTSAIGPLPTDRAALAARGWLVGAPPP